MVIQGERLVKEVQAEFMNAYPFLKIEFFRNGVTRELMHTKQKLVNINARLKDIAILRKSEGLLDVNDNVTVEGLEKEFMDQFGLAVEVFRRSGNIWLETTMTDNWTLKQQNEHGREITIGKKDSSTYINNDDYELNRDADH